MWRKPHHHLSQQKGHSPLPSQVSIEITVLLTKGHTPLPSQVPVFIEITVLAKGHSPLTLLVRIDPITGKYRITVLVKCHSSLTSRIRIDPISGKYRTTVLANGDSPLTSQVSIKSLSWWRVTCLSPLGCRVESYHVRLGVIHLLEELV